MSDIRDKLVKAYLRAVDRCDNTNCGKCEYNGKVDCFAEVVADIMLHDLEFVDCNKSVLFVEEGSIDVTALPNTKIVEYKKGSQPPCMIKIN